MKCDRGKRELKPVFGMPTGVHEVAEDKREVRVRRIVSDRCMNNVQNSRLEVHVRRIDVRPRIAAIVSDRIFFIE